MPSGSFVKRLKGFLSINGRKDWIGLDVGCGPHAGALAQYGLDAAPVAWFVDPTFPWERFTQANVYVMPFEDNRFDYVVSAHLVEHLKRPIDGIIEMARVAKHMVIANVPRYTLDQTKVKDCVKLDHYYLSDHPEIWEELGIRKEDILWQPGATTFYGFEAPHCAWYPTPEDVVELFKKTGCFDTIRGEVCPGNCGESNIFGWLKRDK